MIVIECDGKSNYGSLKQNPVNRVSLSQQIWFDLILFFLKVIDLFGCKFSLLSHSSQVQF